MKVFIAFVIIIVAVFGEEKKISDHERSVNEMLKKASRACGLEMKIEPRYIKDDGYISHPDINVEACIKACVDKKMGVVNQDGTYNLENILSYAETAAMRQRITNTYTSRIKDCDSLVGKEPCKMSACVHGMPKCAYMEIEC